LGAVNTNYIIVDLTRPGIDIGWPGIDIGWPLWNVCVTNEHGYFLRVVSTSRSFHRSWFITGFVTRLTRRFPLVDQELLTRPEHLRSPPGFSSYFSIFSFMCMFYRSLFVLLYLFFVIVLFVFLRFMDSDYLFGIFKLVLHIQGEHP